jgi:protein phosphatase PTC1
MVFLFLQGVLAVTRSLGDHSMKEWVIGTPYTTETVLNEYDTTLILACDGVWIVFMIDLGCITRSRST